MKISKQTDTTQKFQIDNRLIQSLEEKFTNDEIIGLKEINTNYIKKKSNNENDSIELIIEDISSEHSKIFDLNLSKQRWRSDSQKTLYRVKTKT